MARPPFNPVDGLFAPHGPAPQAERLAQATYNAELANLYRQLFNLAPADPLPANNNLMLFQIIARLFDTNQLNPARVRVAAGNADNRIFRYDLGGVNVYNISNDGIYHGGIAPTEANNVQKRYLLNVQLRPIIERVVPVPIPAPGGLAPAPAPAPLAADAEQILFDEVKRRFFEISNLFSIAHTAANIEEYRTIPATNRDPIYGIRKIENHPAAARYELVLLRKNNRTNQYDPTPITAVNRDAVMQAIRAQITAAEEYSHQNGATGLYQQLHNEPAATLGGKAGNGDIDILPHEETQVPKDYIGSPALDRDAYTDVYNELVNNRHNTKLPGKHSIEIGSEEKNSNLTWNFRPHDGTPAAGPSPQYIRVKTKDGEFYLYEPDSYFGGLDAGNNPDPARPKQLIVHKKTGLAGNKVPATKEEVDNLLYDLIYALDIESDKKLDYLRVKLNTGPDKDKVFRFYEQHGIIQEEISKKHVMGTFGRDVTVGLERKYRANDLMRRIQNAVGARDEGIEEEPPAPIFPPPPAPPAPPVRLPPIDEGIAEEPIYVTEINPRGRSFTREEMVAEKLARVTNTDTGAQVTLRGKTKELAEKGAATKARVKLNNLEGDLQTVAINNVITTQAGLAATYGSKGVLKQDSLWHQRINNTKFGGQAGATVDLTAIYRTVFSNCTFDVGCVFPFTKNAYRDKDEQTRMENYYGDLNRQYFNNCTFTAALLNEIRANPAQTQTFEKLFGPIPAHGDFVSPAKTRSFQTVSQPTGQPKTVVEPTQFRQLSVDEIAARRGGGPAPD